MNALAKLSLYGWGAAALLHLGRPALSLGFLGGIGDDLLCTAPIEEFLARDVSRIWFFTRHPGLYASHYGSRVRLIPESDRHIHLARRLGRPMRELSYSTYDAENDRDPPPDEHLIARMCRLAGLRGTVRLRPWLRLSPAELDAAAPFTDAIVIQGGGLDSGVSMANKSWPPAHVVRLARLLSATGRPLVQLGSTRDPALPGVRDLRGRTTLRESAAVLARARLFVGGVGFLMHLARAVDTPSVIVYGGRELPEITGYICNKNLVSRPPCAPCWRRSHCAHGRTCLEEIRPTDVATAVEQLIQLPRHGLAMEEILL